MTKTGKYLAPLIFALCLSCSNPTDMTQETPAFQTGQNDTNDFHEINVILQDYYFDKELNPLDTNKKQLLSGDSLDFALLYLGYYNSSMIKAKEDLISVFTNNGKTYYDVYTDLAFEEWHDEIVDFENEHQVYLFIKPVLGELNFYLEKDEFKKAFRLAQRELDLKSLEPWYKIMKQEFESIINNGEFINAREKARIKQEIINEQAE